MDEDRFKDYKVSEAQNKYFKELIDDPECPDMELDDDSGGYGMVITAFLLGTIGGLVAASVRR